MLTIIQQISRRARSLSATLGLCAVAGAALIGATGNADAGYSCTRNITHVGNLLTIEIVAVSGGEWPFCYEFTNVGTANQNHDVTATVTSTQVGATSESYTAFVRAFPTIGVPLFNVHCDQNGGGGTCSHTASGTMLGVDNVRCDMGNDIGRLPNPALPAVPVILTTICTFTYAQQ